MYLFAGSAAVTMTGNGLPVTWRLFFLTVSKCSPGDLGTNEALRVLSDKTFNLIGSSTSEPGRRKVDFNFGRSSGRFSSGMSSWTSHGLPTAFGASAASTKTAKGLPGTSSPDFFTRMRCSPGSNGTKEMPEKLQNR